MESKTGINVGGKRMKSKQGEGTKNSSRSSQDDPEEEVNSNLLRYSSTLDLDPTPPSAPLTFLEEAAATTPGSETSKRKA